MLRDPATSPTPAAEGDITITPSVLYVGSAVALVTTRNADGSADISPMSSVWALGDRLVLGLTEESKGCENLLRERELVVNFPTPDLWREVEAIARCTGRDPVPPEKAAIGYVFEPDKFRRAGLTPLSAAVIAAPRIKECAIQFEARVMAVHDATRCTPGGAARGFQIIEARGARARASPRSHSRNQLHRLRPMEPAALRLSPLLWSRPRSWTHVQGRGLRPAERRKKCRVQPNSPRRPPSSATRRAPPCSPR